MESRCKLWDTWLKLNRVVHNNCWSLSIIGINHSSSHSKPSGNQTTRTKTQSSTTTSSQLPLPSSSMSIPICHSSIPSIKTWQLPTSSLLNSTLPIHKEVVTLFTRLKNKHLTLFKCIKVRKAILCEVPTKNLIHISLQRHGVTGKLEKRANDHFTCPKRTITFLMVIRSRWVTCQDSELKKSSKRSLKGRMVPLFLIKIC